MKQNPIRLAWFLFFRCKSLELRSKFKKRRLLSSLKTLILYQLGLRKVNAVKKFPFYSHLVVKVHGGYRAFDFKQKTVTKFISADSNPSKVKLEIEGIRKTNQLYFAPRILRWNELERWYEEEYVEGPIGYALVQSGDHVVSNLFGNEIIRCLGKMILLDFPIKVTVGEITKKCSESWENDRLSRVEPKPEMHDAFYRFVQQTLSKLHQNADQTIYLIFSHGDFSFQNIIIAENGLKVIDWESIANRSVLYDLHNFFLTELYYKRSSKSLVNDVAEAIAALESYLTSDNHYGITYNFDELSETYRWLYYIERLHMLFERGLNNQILNVIYRSIEVFMEFEKSAVKQLKCY